MTRIKSLLRGSLVLALLVGSLPAWTCVSSMAGMSGGHTLACVRSCAMAEALFTHNGKLASLGNGTCHVQVKAAQSLGMAEAPDTAPAPDQALSAPLPAPAQALVQPLAQAVESRGPPSGAAYLLCQHPYANGPPTLV